MNGDGQFDQYGLMNVVIGISVVKRIVVIKSETSNLMQYKETIE